MPFLSFTLLGAWLAALLHQNKWRKVLHNSYDELTIIMDLFTDDNQSAVKNAQDVEKRNKKELINFDVDIDVNIK